MAASGRLKALKICRIFGPPTAWPGPGPAPPMGAVRSEGAPWPKSQIKRPSLRPKINAPKLPVEAQTGQRQTEIRPYWSGSRKGLEAAGGRRPPSAGPTSAAADCLSSGSPKARRFAPVRRGQTGSEMDAAQGASDPHAADTAWSRTPNASPAALPRQQRGSFWGAPRHGQSRRWFKAAHAGGQRGGGAPANLKLVENPFARTIEEPARPDGRLLARPAPQRFIVFLRRTCRFGRPRNTSYKSLQEAVLEGGHRGAGPRNVILYAHLEPPAT